LFGGLIPKLKKDVFYSLQWSGAAPFESCYAMATKFSQVKTADDFFNNIDELGVYHSFPA
jgi:hypothetical protein